MRATVSGCAIALALFVATAVAGAVLVITGARGPGPPPAARRMNFQQAMVWSAYAEVVLVLALTVPTFLWLAPNEPPFVLGLSIYAIFTTALGRISAARADRRLVEQEEA